MNSELEKEIISLLEDIKTEITSLLGLEENMQYCIDKLSWRIDDILEKLKEN